MTELLWHGRGGQGAFTAAKLLGAAYSLSEGQFALAFPSFGPERRGAPILAFTKLDSKQIGDRSQIKKADYVIYLDDTLFSPSAFNEIKEGGKILINSKRAREDFLKVVSTGPTDGRTSAVFGPVETIGRSVEQLITFDADSLALEILKMPVTNTVMLALLAKLSGVVSEAQLDAAIEEYMPGKIAAKNVVLVGEVFKRAGGNV